MTPELQAELDRLRGMAETWHLLCEEARRERDTAVQLGNDCVEAGKALEAQVREARQEAATLRARVEALREALKVARDESEEILTYLIDDRLRTRVHRIRVDATTALALGAEVKPDGAP